MPAYFRSSPPQRLQRLPLPKLILPQDAQRRGSGIQPNRAKTTTTAPVTTGTGAVATSLS